MTVSEDILVVAPIGADGANIREALAQAGLQPRLCRDSQEAAAGIRAGAGALLVTEEAVMGDRQGAFAAALEAQPPWSDLPVILVASSSTLPQWARHASRALGDRSNVTLIGRPLQKVTLVAAVRAVLRARRRQYQVRDLLRENAALLTSLERRVEERTAKLQELVTELESFSYSVSHDLRAPLRVMAGYAKVLLEDHGETLTPAVHDYVDRIARAAERMDQLTRDVLAYTRLSRGEAVMEDVALDTLVHDLLDQYPELAAARDAIAVRPGLAPVRAHPPAMAQAIANLIGNAVKFARAGVPLRIEVYTEPVGDRVRIVVRDNGVGIAEAYHEKIFRLFERVAGRDVPGTGIGLAIVKRAAERMGGTVGVTSVLGEGSAFWIELPRAGTAGGKAD